MHSSTPALHRRRGPVRQIRSDNGTNFVGAWNELLQAIEEGDHEEIRVKLPIFNPSAASHMGGVSERQIRITRKVLSGLMDEYGHCLDEESFRTLMCEVDAIINSRPLTTASGEPGDLEPLTPNHILTTKSTVKLPPPGKFQQNDVCKFIFVPIEEGISSSNVRKKQMAKSSTKPGRRRYCTDSRRECPT